MTLDELIDSLVEIRDTAKDYNVKFEIVESTIGKGTWEYLFDISGVYVDDKDKTIQIY